MSSPQAPLSLWASKAEREKYESYADLFAIIKTVEKLEKVRTHGEDALPLLTASRRTCATRCGRKSTRAPA